MPYILKIHAQYYHAPTGIPNLICLDKIVFEILALAFPALWLAFGTPMNTYIKKQQSSLSHTKHTDGLKECSCSALILYWYWQIDFLFSKPGQRIWLGFVYILADLGRAVQNVLLWRRLIFTDIIHRGRILQSKWPN